VDFLQSMQLVVNLVWLPRYMYYSGRIFTYKLDRTTVTVGAPRMLAISTSPASADASSSASVAAGSSTAGAALSATGTCGTTSVMGGGRAAVSLSQLPHRIPVAFVPLVNGVRRRNLLQAFGNQLSAYATITSQELTNST
jgi:hypothetical protein